MRPINTFTRPQAFVRRGLHLIDVPICLQIAEVADSGICSETFNFDSIPKRKGLVVTGTEKSRTSLLEGIDRQTRTSVLA